MRGGAVVAAACSACSRGQKIGFLGNGAANDLTVTGLDVAEAGEYKLVINYLVSGTRTLKVSVNGGPAVALPLSGSSFATPTSTSLTVTLVAGSNAVRFFNDTAYAPDLDRVIVARV